MANDGVAQASGEYARAGMVRGFADVSFGLAVGQVGMASYDASTCPFGWHIIKRLE